jgi:hypothetical protein
MYGNEDDPYGEEMDGDEDRNDGLNALVILRLFTQCYLELAMGDWNKQRYRLGCAQLDYS